MKSRSFRLPKSGTKTGNKNATPAVCDDDSKKCTIEGPSGVQQARRNLVKTDDVVSDRTIHLTDSWFNTSSRRLIVESPSAGKPPRRPTHTRNLSEDTASSSCSVDDSRLRAAKEFGLMIAKNKRLPTVCPGFVSSNHVLVNKERTALHLPALTRRLELDELAREFATAMAKKGKVKHGPIDVEDRIDPCDAFGVNCASGLSVQEIHEKMLLNPSERSKMVDRRYSQMGMGTAKGKNGKLYLCQIFKG